MTTLSELPKANQERCPDIANVHSFHDEITSIGAVVHCGGAQNAINADRRLLASYPTLREARGSLLTRGAS
jgi:hypothetical protein